MRRVFLNSKIHKAVVTGADLEYEGSFGIDSDILKKANILPNEQIHVFNITNGNRFVTYAIPAAAGSKTMCANGACAHLTQRGDEVIICTFADLDEAEISGHIPTIVFMSEYVLENIDG